MQPDEHEAIQKLGATARAVGRSRFDNPYLRTDHLPIATGETPAEWSAKRDAWKIGWLAEDLMRDAHPLHVPTRAA